MTRGPVARLTSVVAPLMLVGACATGSPYFPRDATARTFAGGPADTAETALIGVADLVAHPNDVITLTRVEAIDLAGDADMVPYVLRRNETDGGGIGWMREEDASGPNDFRFSEHARSLPGFAFSPEDGVIQVVLGFRNPRSAIVSFRAVGVLFRINGGSEQREEFEAGGAVCFGHPRPGSCQAPSPLDGPK